MAHKIVVTPSAKRSIKKLPIQVKQDIVSAIKILETNPFAGEKLSGALNFLYSLHFKSFNIDYRIAYTISHKDKLIIVHFANTRENFYEKLRKLFD